MDAQPLGALPARARGTTVAATAEGGDPSPTCAGTSGSVWYRVSGAAPGRTAVTLQARGQLEAVVAVYRRDRSHLTGLACSRTDTRGRAGAAFQVRHGHTYLVLVAQQPGSMRGPFELRVLKPERPERAPGRALPVGGAWSRVNRLLDPDDVWSIDLRAGTVYRIDLVHNADRCLPVELYRPGLGDFVGAEPILTWRCAGYKTFAPGPDGGGLYSLRIKSHTAYRGTQAYRLQVAAAEDDDVAPGVFLQSGQRLTGSLSPRTIDTLDLYRFVAPRRSVLTVKLDDEANAILDLLVVTEDGKIVRCKCSEQGPFKLRLRLQPGHYYLALRAKDKPLISYRMLLLVRDITSTGLLANGLKHVQVAPGQALSLVAATRTSLGGPAFGAAGGIMRIQFDRLDPFAGWAFVALTRVPVDLDGSALLTWTPPSVGRWRAHAVFFGTLNTNPSSSGYLFVDVEEPFGP